MRCTEFLAPTGLPAIRSDEDAQDVSGWKRPVRNLKPVRTFSENRSNQSCISESPAILPMWIDNTDVGAGPSTAGESLKEGCDSASLP
jgi:hypothetical protein